MVFKGMIPKSIIESSKNLGRSFIQQADFDKYNVKYRAPVEGEFRGNRIYSMSPPSSGGIHVIQILTSYQI